MNGRNVLFNQLKTYVHPTHCLITYVLRVILCVFLLRIVLNKILLLLMGESTELCPFLPRNV